MTAAQLKVEKASKKGHIPVDQAGTQLAKEMLKAKSDFFAAVVRGDKQQIRALHERSKLILEEQPGIMEMRKGLRRFGHLFAHGRTIDPEKIAPRLILVCRRDWTEEVFRLARTSWSLPYSKGYGRRLRFLVFDDAHNAVIGIIGLQSAPIDLYCRDVLIPAGTPKLAWVNSTLDAYTVGAIEPYRGLLGGKLVAGMLATDEIRQAYWAKYAGKAAVMSGKKGNQPLLAITTTSAFGRSSIYNRLRMGDRVLAEPIGYTKGYGLIHLEHLYPRIRAWMESRGELIPAGFGNGPKVRWQNTQTAIYRLGISEDTLAHGLAREVFIFRLVSNFAEAAQLNETPKTVSLSASDWAAYWKKRYCSGRAQRTQAFREVDGRQVIADAIELFAHAK